MGIIVVVFTYLRPTAACFRSDRHRRKAEIRIARPQRRMEPGCRQKSVMCLGRECDKPKLPRCLS
jgi:hypothetical protein